MYTDSVANYLRLPGAVSSFVLISLSGIFWGSSIPTVRGQYVVEVYSVSIAVNVKRRVVHLIRARMSKDIKNMGAHVHECLPFDS